MLLLELPPEIIEMIGEAAVSDYKGWRWCLPIPQYNPLYRLRLTCRTLWDILARCDYRYRFEKVKAPFNAKGLARLASIAQDDMARRAVRRVALTYVRGKCYRMDMHYDIPPRRPDDRLDTLDQQERIAALRDLLVNKFPHCTDLVFSAQQLPHDVNMLREPTGAENCAAMLWALAAPGLQVERIQLAIGEGTPLSQCVAPGLFENPDFCASWARVKKLRIVIPDPRSENGPIPERLFSAAKNLDLLCLKGKDYCHDAESVLQSLIAAEELPPIKTLRLEDLGRVKVETLKTLLALLRGSLKSLHLRKLQLVDGKWKDFIYELAQEKGPALDEVYLCNCHEGVYNFRRYPGNSILCPLFNRALFSYTEPHRRPTGCGTIEIQQSSIDMYKLTEADPPEHRKAIIFARCSGDERGLKLALECVAQGVYNTADPEAVRTQPDYHRPKAKCGGVHGCIEDCVEDGCPFYFCADHGASHPRLDW